VSTLAPLDRTPTTRPTALRRTALAIAGVPACALPLVWTAGTVAELATGAERDHLFHQLTGQGLLLGALWLGGLLPLLIAGRMAGQAPRCLGGRAHGARRGPGW